MSRRFPRMLLTGLLLLQELIDNFYSRIPGRGPLDLVTCARAARQAVFWLKEKFICWEFVTQGPLPPSPPAGLQQWPDAREQWAATLASSPPSTWIVRETKGRRSSAINMPSELHAVLEAAASCDATTCLVNLLALDRGVDLLRVKSKSLGGPCLVTQLRVATGFFCGENVSNPLIYDPDGNRCHTLLSPPRDLDAEGRRGFGHAWLEADLVAPSGEQLTMGLDPTVAQFGGGKSIVVWYPGLDGAEEVAARYVLDAQPSCLDRYVVMQRLVGLCVAVGPAVIM